uniref:Uncharacterized protein n=1 Tax=Arundo donax TaxID=35708 RepID=A0A0A9GH44_ARUDO
MQESSNIREITRPSKTTTKKEGKKKYMYI